ncbi:MAG: biotin/lipoyl-containing protein [Myxococcota bacterium]
MNYDVSEKKGASVMVGLQEVEEGIYDITIDGETVRVDAAMTGRTIYSVIEEGRQFEVLVDERGAHGFDVLVGARLFHLEAVDERSRLLSQQVRLVAEGPQTVEAEMPGKVVKLEKRAGDPVRGGEGVVIIEAMKMENEIPSPIDGRVVEIAVREGETVETGAKLFEVEPADDEAA